MRRQSFDITDDVKRDVVLMAGLGIGKREIAKVAKIPPAELKRQFRGDLEREAIQSNRQVLQCLYDMAVSGKHSTVTMFWAKARCGLQQKKASGITLSPIEKIVFFEEALHFGPTDCEKVQ